MSAALLPNELLQHILADLVAGEDLSVRFERRRAFSRVCSAWRASILQPWAEVALASPAEVLALAELLEEGTLTTLLDGERVPVERAVEAVSFALQTKSELYSRAQLRRLLGRLGRMRCIEIEGGSAAGLTEQHELVDLLSLIRGVKHLTLAGSTAATHPLQLGGLTLPALVREWSTLESLAMRRCHFTSSTTLLASAFSPRLRTVKLDVFSCGGEYAHLISSLPASVRSLSLNHQRLWSHQVVADQFETALAGIAPQLDELELLTMESMEGAWMIESSAQHARVFLAMIDKLARVEKLTLPLCTVSKLKHSIPSLSKLVHLGLFAAEAEKGARLVAGELVAVLDNAPPSLEKVSVDAAARASWSQEEQEQVDNALGRQTITLRAV